MKSLDTARNALLLTLLVLLVLGAPALGQNPAGTLIGKVKSDGEALPGVVVSAESESLQGTRSTVTGVNGAYKLGFLPPGEYVISYVLDGFATSTREVKLSIAQTTRSDIAMQLSDVSEEIVVTAIRETISESSTVSSTYTQADINDLALNRSIDSTVALAPGVHQTGPTPSGARIPQISISGAMSFENLFLVNGVTVNENLRGQPLDIYIEDALLETTVATASVSAEYGRFTGGVVNVITKSGSNTLHGSVRVNLDNEDWESATPLTTFQEDVTNETYEGTLGGRVILDHLWFFGAVRDRETVGSDQTAQTNVSFSTGSAQERYEGKLTITPIEQHSVVLSYLEVEDVSQGTFFGSILDTLALTDRADPQELLAAHYSGILSSHWFVEAQYSERQLGLGIGSGGPRDLIAGSSFEDTVSGQFNWHAPAFCGECEEEERSNENFLIKGSHFLTSERAGTHDIVFGYDQFSDITFDINHQTGSDFRMGVDTFLIDPATNEVFPVINNTGGSWITLWPVFGLDRAQKTDFQTNSFYVNDRWQLDDKWSFNIGVRYDENEGIDAGGNNISDDSNIGPRLSVAYDVKGDGDLILRAGYGTYTASLVNDQANSAATGGAIGLAVLTYTGDPINTDSSCVQTGTCIDGDTAMQLLFDFWFSHGGTNPLVDPPEAIAGIPNVEFLNFPGTDSNQIVPDSFKSPNTEEITIGVSKRLGTKGVFRADVVRREWSDFYSDRTDLSTGQVLLEGIPADLTHIGNFGDDVLRREYLGLHSQLTYRVNQKLRVSASYTLSQLEGNINGETTQNATISVDPNAYPEYHDPSWRFPVGDLGSDQRHKLLAWASYNVINNDHHRLNATIMQRFQSGTPYGSPGSVSSPNFVTNPGYISPPGTQTYWFENRDTYRTDDVTSTDLAFTYSFQWNAFGKQVEVYLTPQILNVFGEDSVLNVDNGIFDATSDSSLAPFNPFTDTPVEGVNWRKDDRTFGQAQSQLDFQTPRTFRFSVGFRF